MTQTVERMLPLYEGKMGSQYDHRAATFVGVGDTDIETNTSHANDTVVMPRYWVREEVVDDRLSRRSWGSEDALLGFRRVARNTDERTVIASLIPFGAASYGWILSAGPDAQAAALLVAQYNSFAFDYVLRQFLSQPSIPQGTFEQLPILAPEAFASLDRIVGSGVEWVTDRVVLLTGTGTEMAEFVHALGRESWLPIAWDEGGRAVARLELDAAMLHLFGVARSDVEYILEAFPIVKRKDQRDHGEYRTKRLILEAYDAMQVAIDGGVPYRSPWDAEFLG
jgi:hypothetical protein